MDSTNVALFILQMVGAGAGLFLLLGLWTPIVAGATALVQICVACSRAGHVWSAVLAAAIAAALSLLGPGAWSLDALAYGRKKIFFGDR